MPGTVAGLTPRQSLLYNSAMHSLESELSQLHESGLVDEATAARAIAIESGGIFTLYQELRVALYVAVSLIVAGVGLFLKQHLAEIGPLTIVSTLALLALPGYALAIRDARRGGDRSLAGDYLLLLSALLLSANLGYSEAQFHWLGERWSLHLLLLAALHGITAYALDSRLVLSLALASLAAWFGLDAGSVAWLARPRGLTETGARALACAGLILLWRWIHPRIGRSPGFAEVLEHFIVNIACWGGLAWCFEGSTRWAGLAVVLTVATLSVRRGLRTGGELLVVYGVLYGAIALCTLAGITGVFGGASYVLAVMLSAAGLLWHWHQQLRNRPGP